MAGCKDKYKFNSSESSSKAALRTRGAIDEFLNITNLVKFRKLNTLWSNNAKERFGIKERLFYEDNNKGTIVDIERYDKTVLFNIKNNDKEYLIPNNQNIIDKIDINNKRIYIKDIKGLFD